MPRNGFTLIELLIVIAIIGILAVGAFVAFDPLTRFQDARDAQRWEDAVAVLDAAKVHQVDNGGAYATEISGLTADTDYMIGTATTGCNATCDVTIGATNCVDLSGSALISGGYLASVPISPNGTGSWDATLTGYYVNRSSTGTLTVGACEAEGTSSISVSK
ncbi:type II secretion system protein [candidate division WWE3 bacterium]|uniref:Type II secretion system protein n=1 Tax=candidate division WWE3 bacterium TaxID=2053526 RepID=A0A955LVE0_UNCKA|nr:type II secretion system protein [candidate division WWE3 bacterium]